MPQSGGTEHNGATYATIRDHIIQQVQKNYKHGQDVATSIRNMEVIDLSKEAPVRKVSEKSNNTEKKVEQDGFNLIYNVEYTRFAKQQEALSQNLIKTYALILSNYCTKGMENRIEEHPEFETKIRDDPIELLKAIEMLVHNPMRTRYPFASLMEAIN